MAADEYVDRLARRGNVRNVVARHRVLGVALSAAALLVGLAIPAQAAGAPTVGVRHRIPSAFVVSEFDALACPPGTSIATTCYLIGTRGSALSGTPALVPVRNGQPGTPVDLPTAASGGELACVSGGACETVRDSTPYRAAFVPIDNGQPGHPVAIAGDDVWTGIACVSPRNCVAVGQRHSGSAGSTDSGVIAVLRNGNALTPQRFAGVNDFDSVSCLTATRCVAVGKSHDLKHGLFVDITNGHAGPVHVVRAAQYGLFDVGCKWTKDTCAAFGFNPPFPVLVVIHGTRVTTKTLPTSENEIGFTCPRVGHCLVFGEVNQDEPSQHGIVAVATHGHIGPAAAVHGILDTDWASCVTVGSCEAYTSKPDPHTPGGYIVSTFAVTY